MQDLEKLEKVIKLIEDSELDPAIKEILVRDLQAEGLTEYMLELVKAYCMGDEAQIHEFAGVVDSALEEKKINVNS